MGQISFIFACACMVFLILFVEKTVLSPLNDLGTIDKLFDDIFEFISGLFILSHISLFMPVPHCFNLTYFLSSFRFIEKISKVQRVSIYSFSSHISPIFDIWHLCGAYITIDEPVLTDYY